MMMNQSKQQQAVVKAIDSGLLFAYFLYPNDSEEHFLATDHICELFDEASFDRFEGFVFNKFSLDQTIKAYGLRLDLTADDVLHKEFKSGHYEFKSPEIQESTDKASYLRQANHIINALHSDEEKTVLSHLECIDSDKSFLEIVRGYFNSMDGCFRYIFYTPIMGLWFGASPELLVKYNHTTFELDSMSLAGTRNAGQSHDKWDKKNRIEHDLVTKHIINVLSGFGQNVGEPIETDLQFGNIVHLCHWIHSKGAVSLARLLPLLSPTPALLGWPREQAFHQLNETEAHNRLCYGGFVGYKDPEITTLFVNLRCGMAWPNKENHCRLNLFSGGGLTARSAPESEWDEAKSKLVKIIEHI